MIPKKQRNLPSRSGDIATQEEYKGGKKITRDLEQKLANTLSDTKEFEKLGFVLIQTQRQLKEIVIALGPAMSKHQDDDVVMSRITTPSTSVLTKRKPQKNNKRPSQIRSSTPPHPRSLVSLN